jgi:hypothetical protein
MTNQIIEFARLNCLESFNIIIKNETSIKNLLIFIDIFESICLNLQKSLKKLKKGLESQKFLFGNYLKFFNCHFYNLKF